MSTPDYKEKTVDELGVTPNAQSHDFLLGKKKTA
jgi:hypothetical protein